MITESDAREVAEEVLADWNCERGLSSPSEDEIVVWKVEEHPRAWVVHFATQNWIRTKDFSHLLVGASPLVVEKATGQLHQYGSAPDQYAAYRSWLDEPDA